MDANNSEVLLARSLRPAVVQQQYNAGALTETEARDILAGPLSPDDPSTVVDDSGLLDAGEWPKVMHTHPENMHKIITWLQAIFVLNAVTALIIPVILMRLSK